MSAEKKCITLEAAQRRADQLLLFLEMLGDRKERALTDIQVTSTLRTIDDLIDYNWLYWMCKNIVGETDGEVVDNLKQSEGEVKAMLDECWGEGWETQGEQEQE